MASVILRKELECSICLNIFKEPVMLQCGHNFCQDCITHEFETNKIFEGWGLSRHAVYFCPKCREKIFSFYSFTKNINLCHMTERILSQTNKLLTTSETICTYCVESPIPAVQSCLHCESSLCDKHLKGHSNSAKHILSEPSTSLEIKQCSDHNKSLEYYCIQDAVCICLYCNLIGEHQGHRSVERNKVTALREDLQAEDPDTTRRVLTEISRKKAQHSLPASDLTQDQKIKTAELSSKVRHTKELHTMTVPLPDLQYSAMVSADLAKDLKCYICLNIFWDPVMLRCGHNFCCDCLMHHLETHKVLEGVIFEVEHYFCPECKDRYSEKPLGVRNITLRNMAEHFPRQTNKSWIASGTFCTYCVDSPIPAVQSCLHCEASLCDKHLKVHSKSAKHVLTDPTDSLERSKCSDHNKSLEYYCTEDSTCICLYCCLIGEHKGHKTGTRGEKTETERCSAETVG